MLKPVTKQHGYEYRFVWIFLGTALLSIACEQVPSQNAVPVSDDEQAEQRQFPRSIAEETDLLQCSWDSSQLPISNRESFNRKPAQPNWGIGF